MKRFVWLAAFILMSILLGGTSFASERTVTLKVDNMTCASCPPMVKKALGKVGGVSKVAVTYDKKTSSGTAVITFDGSKAKESDLMEAVKNAGFPSKVAAPN